MKKSHILAIVVIAAAIGIIIATAGDASTYVNFNQAYKMAEAGNKTSIHVVGQLKKDDNGHVIGLDNAPDNLSFSFILVDDNNREQKVFYNEPMPPDFTRSENVVVIGGYQGDNFVASKILLKCPSKYQEQSVNAGI
ncbi:MAG TPA: cytochrome C biogenesis protein [Cytophagales bacterium]|nr:cytochrome C biogenesis protein [Cytophagales bacterium]HCR54124.1 cytochrome C biogenesis protein [Cytophagales bacterium]